MKLINRTKYVKEIFVCAVNLFHLWCEADETWAWVLDGVKNRVLKPINKSFHLFRYFSHSKIATDRAELSREALKCDLFRHVNWKMLLITSSSTTFFSHRNCKWEYEDFFFLVFEFTIESHKWFISSVVNSDSLWNLTQKKKRFRSLYRPLRCDVHTTRIIYSEEFNRISHNLWSSSRLSSSPIVFRLLQPYISLLNSDRTRLDE